MGKFQKAVKSKSKLRLAIFGPSGSGKTYSALSIATGLGKKIAVIDTEAGSASKYAGKGGFAFDVAELEIPTIENYIEIIESASGAYDVLIIDSLTHGWQELLEEIEKLAKAKYAGNTFRAWGEGTPKQKRFVRAILSNKCHIIATMRSKTEWVVNNNDKGRAVPQRVGTSPEQGKGIEYEFDMLLEMSPEHVGNVIKDRTGKFQDLLIEKPDTKFGEKLQVWLNDGEDILEPKQTEKKQPEKKQSDPTPANKEEQPWEHSITYELAEQINNAQTLSALKAVGTAISGAKKRAEINDEEAAYLKGFYSKKGHEFN